MFKTAISFFREITLSPKTAAERIARGEELLKPAVVIYITYAFFYSAIAALRPAGFPSQYAGVENPGFAVLLATEFSLGAALQLFVALFAAGFAAAAGRLKTALFFPLSAAALAAGAFTAVAIPWGGEAIALCAFLGGIYAVSRSSNYFLKILILCLAVSSVGVILMPLQCAVTWLRWENGFIALQAIEGLWMLWIAAEGIKKICRISTAKSAASFVFAMLASLVLLYGLYKAGIISKTVLTAVFS